MNAPLTVDLREFMSARDDPRLIVLDVRAPAVRSAYPLRNTLFPVLFVQHEALARDPLPIATLLGGRHVVVVDSEECGAVDAVRTLRYAEVECAALEDGVSGWSSAIVRIWSRQLGDLEIVALQRLSDSLCSYLLVRGGEAVVVDPRGRSECFIAELVRRRARAIAIVETASTQADSLCGRALAWRTGAAYYASGDRAPERTTRRVVVPFSPRSCSSVESPVVRSTICLAARTFSR
jgi:hypothetical protein